MYVYKIRSKMTYNRVKQKALQKVPYIQLIKQF